MAGPHLVLLAFQIRADVAGTTGLARSDGIIAIVVLLTATALAVFAGQRAAHYSRRMTEALAEAPPLSTDEFDAFDPAEGTRDLRSMSRRMSVYGVLSLALAVSGIVAVVSGSPDGRFLESELPGWGPGSENYEGIAILSFVIGAVAVVFTAAAKYTWSSRYRAVLAAGWRSATVTVRPDFGEEIEERKATVYDVRFPDGERLTLRGLQMSFRNGNRFAGKAEVPVWVGGGGPERTVLFRLGRTETCYPVPVRL
ncbi:hypothetical protein [Amycolatopsis azurea]|uniref:Uncharacterized protein n=1 Tax=Amycolatopsis azurea DSM 43854 TaxID=1238180 RepID=M2QM02_9PSEU|nr:hypothetical protein [Amycolatopsis azurea]EMD27731.1 hypothetical protein C791_2027 [Amycolatopsis azurea DSM 43854]OOC03120.1 hypothetical protein B0293_29640 [Amycolatopsis azurea DSM 43854]